MTRRDGRMIGVQWLRKSFVLWVPLWFQSLIFIGCGNSGLLAVSGTVTLDGQPLQQGTIHFAPIDGQAPSQAAMIDGGSFSTQLHRTNYKVQIFSPKPTSAAPP